MDGTAHMENFFSRSYGCTTLTFPAGKHPQFWECAAGRKCVKKKKITPKQTFFELSDGKRYHNGKCFNVIYSGKEWEKLKAENSVMRRMVNNKIKYEANKHDDHPVYKALPHQMLPRDGEPPIPKGRGARRLTGIEKRFRQQGLLQ